MVTLKDLITTDALSLKNYREPSKNQMNDLMDPRGLRGSTIKSKQSNARRVLRTLFVHGWAWWRSEEPKLATMRSALFSRAEMLVANQALTSEVSATNAMLQSDYFSNKISWHPAFYQFHQEKREQVDWGEQLHQEKREQFHQEKRLQDRGIQ